MQYAGVEVTHPDKEMYPELGVTKGDVARYYHKYAQRIVKYLRHRPVTLVRGPHGVGGPMFYQRHPAEYFPDYIDRVKVSMKSGTGMYIELDAEEDLIYLVNQGVLEFHAWGSKVSHIDKPDLLIWDLDPGEGCPWELLVQCAHLVQDKLEKLKLEPFIKLSGSKGIHIYLHIKPQYTWDEGKAFALDIAGQIAAAAPDKFTTELPKQKRVGKVFIDYLRNSKGGTAVSPFSLRAKSGGGVSLPITWETLKKHSHADDFNITDALSKPLVEDNWEDLFSKTYSLP